MLARARGRLADPDRDLRGRRPDGRQSRRYPADASPARCVGRSASRRRWRSSPRVPTRSGARPASTPPTRRPIRRANWTPLDTEIRDAAADGIAVDLNVTGGAPLWADRPRVAAGRTSAASCHDWEPSASQFGQFVHAVAVRYGGSFDPLTARSPRSNPADLPRVSFWSIWNEPNYGPSLAPQALPGTRTVEDSRPVWTALLSISAWSRAAGDRPSAPTRSCSATSPRAGP